MGCLFASLQRYKIEKKNQKCTEQNVKKFLLQHLDPYYSPKQTPPKQKTARKPRGLLAVLVIPLGLDCATGRGAVVCSLVDTLPTSLEGRSSVGSSNPTETKNSEEAQRPPRCFGDPAGARTQDPNIKSVVLYRLSYEISGQNKRATNAATTQFWWCKSRKKIHSHQICT